MGSPMGPMPPMGGPMMEQGLQGLSKGMPGGDPLQALKSLQATPGPSAEESALKQAREALGFAMSKLQLRSPKAAKHLATALIELDGANRELALAPKQEVAPPPPGLPMSGMLTGGAPGGAGGGVM